MYKTVLFDLDGTLLDTLQDLANAGNHTLSCLGLEQHPTNNYKSMVGNGIPKLIERMLPENNRGESTREIANKLFFKYYENHLDDFTEPYSGIIELLEVLKNNKIKIGVITNKAEKFTEEIVEKYFPNTFDIVIGTSEEFPPKPNPIGVNYAREFLCSASAETLYCGDSNVDMQTAISAKLDSCGVLWGFRSEEELEKEGAIFIAHNTEELKNIILYTDVS